MTPKILNILLIVLSWLLYSFIVSPLYFGTTSALFSEGQSFKDLVKSRNDYDKALKEVPELIKQSELAVRTYKNIPEVDRKNILVMVPVAINDIKFMSELTNIGEESVSLDGMGIKDKGNGTYTVSFSVSTTYTNFKKVISVWEKSMRLFTVESISFAPGKTEEDLIKFNVQFLTYYLK